MTSQQNEKRIQPGFWIGLVMVIVLLLLTTKYCHGKAVYDTIPCRTECIKKFIEKPTKSGNSRIFAIYADESIHDIIPVSAAVHDYIILCKQNGISPSLGIKLRNGQIYSIIKVRKYVKKTIK